MSIHFRRVLKKTSLNSLREYLLHLSVNDFSDIEWEDPRDTLIDAITERVAMLEQPLSDRLYLDFDRVGQFADENARRVLRGVVEEEFLDAFDAVEGVYGCAFFVMSRDSDAFDEALSSLYADRLLNGRDWTGFDFEPGRDPVVRTEPQIDELRQRLSEIFSSDGPLPRVILDRFTRREQRGASVATSVREQITIYIEGTPETELAFTESSVEPHVVHPVREGAILFDPRDKTLDVVGERANKDQRKDIAEAFLETMLEDGAELRSVTDGRSI